MNTLYKLFLPFLSFRIVKKPHATTNFVIVRTCFLILLFFFPFQVKAEFNHSGMMFRECSFKIPLNVEVIDGVYRVKPCEFLRKGRYEMPSCFSFSTHIGKGQRESIPNQSPEKCTNNSASDTDQRYMICTRFQFYTFYLIGVIIGLCISVGILYMWFKWKLHQM